ncbi:unnamed protein product [Durusdinium trenchii]|uniref:Thioredoxin domain-containing protein n=1 Tax=Durusdinium trenchii TaxID=1381693 RepID=A0ABP0P543_9DINO
MASWQLCRLAGARTASACRARRLLVARQVGHKIQPIQLRGFAAIDPGSGVSLISPTAKTVLVAGAAAAGVGGLYLVCPPGDRYNIDIKPISDEVFNNHDNLFVFYFEKAEDLNERSEDFHRVISSLVQEPVLKKVTYYQNVRKDGDPALPGGEEREDKPLRVVMYKGQRKSVLLIGDKIPKEEIVDFYKPVSQDLSKIKVPKKVPMVSNSSFHKDVLEASGPRKPMVLLQMFEDTCFLCFLMRPFVNSLGELLHEHKAPFVIKRFSPQSGGFACHSFGIWWAEIAKDKH